MKLTKLDHKIANKKLNRVKVMLEKVNNNILRFVKTYGFERIPRSQQSSSKLVFTHKKLGVVVKVPYLSGDTADIPLHSIPTIVVRRPRVQSWDYAHILIQPLGRLTNTDEAHAILERRAEVIADSHEGNVAWYKNCPVWIDW